MFVAATIAGCVVCYTVVQLWIKPRREPRGPDDASCSVGMLGGLIEPRK